MSGGFIKVHRKMTEWGWYSDPNTFRVFMHLLLTASYEDNEFRGHKIKAGQVVTGRKKLASDLGMSERSVRTSLEHLISTNEITIKSTNKFSIITVENWAKYQCDARATDQQNVQQTTSNRPAKRPTTDHTQEIKNKENNNKGRFTPPSVEEVKAYCSERKNRINAEEFVDFYASKGWMVGKNKMKDWKACVRTWERNRRNKIEPKSRSNVYTPPEPPKYKEFTPDPEIEAVQMPDDIREKLRGLF